MTTKEEKNQPVKDTPGLVHPPARGAIRNSGTVTEVKKNEFGETVVAFDLVQSQLVQPVTATPVVQQVTGPRERKTIASPTVNINGKQASVSDIKAGDRILFTGDPATMIDVERDEEAVVNPEGPQESEAKEEHEAEHKRAVAEKKSHSK